MEKIKEIPLQFGENVFKIQASYKKKKGYVQISLEDHILDEIMKQICMNMKNEKHMPFGTLTIGIQK